MKKTIALLLALCAVLAGLCACNSGKEEHIIIKDENGTVIADTNEGDKVEIDNETGNITITDKEGTETVIDTNKKPTTVITGNGNNATSSTISGPFEKPVSSDGATTINSDGGNNSSTETTTSGDVSEAPASSGLDYSGIESAEDWL